MDDNRYISFDEFVRLSGRKPNTIRKKYKQIPGIEKRGKNFYVLSGTRYPGVFHGYKFRNSADRKYALLKAIDEYKYVCHTDLRIEERQFEDMLAELHQAGLIKKNHLHNNYGANEYDCTARGSAIFRKQKMKAIRELTAIAGEAIGTGIGAAVAQICDIGA